MRLPTFRSLVLSAALLKPVDPAIQETQEMPVFISYLNKTPSDNEQTAGEKPDNRRAGSGRDHRSDHEKWDDSNEKRDPDSCIKQNPGGHRRYSQHDRRIERDAEQAQLPQAERQDDGENDDRDPKYVSHAIALIAMIGGIGRQLSFEKVVHVASTEK